VPLLLLNWVNLVQVSALTLLVFGLYLLKGYKHYRLVQAFFVFVLALVVANIAEEVFNTRQWYLVSPIFVVGYGPMLYLVARSLVHQSINRKGIYHFLPMFASLFFTQHPQWVIGFGTILQAIYAAMTFLLVLNFNKELLSKRSDSEDLSLTWFAWLFGVSTMVHVFDLVRLNIQPFIDLDTNLLGQLLSTIIGVVVMAVMLKKLLQYNEGILSLIEQNEIDEVSGTDDSKGDDFLSIFEHLDTDIKLKGLYRQPRLSLTDLSNQTGLQSRDISRAINLHSGLNFNDYINQFRVEDVKRAILSAPNASLLELALVVGFNSKTSFNQTFKRLTGETPSAFKKRHIKT
jgi:AraC-like DNA-binding protein